MQLRVQDMKKGMQVIELSDSGPGYLLMKITEDPRRVEDHEDYADGWVVNSRCIKNTMDHGSSPGDEVLLFESDDYPAPFAWITPASYQEVGGVL